VSLTILSVAYPFAPVGADAAGGAEQVLTMLDAGIVRAGHRSIVLAQEGSVTAGELVPVPAETGDLTEAARAEFRLHYRGTIEGLLAGREIDLVHFHGIDFPDYLPRVPEQSAIGAHPGPQDEGRSCDPARSRLRLLSRRTGPAILATLHLPPAWYPASVFSDEQEGPWLNPVSHAQAAACPPSERLLDPIENGVDVAGLQRARHAKRDYAMLLARVCPEKGIHLAIDAAKRADATLLIAGALFPYPDHVRYFREEVEPRLDARRRFIGPVGFARKRRLLCGAGCLLVPSTADETSSLAAREAIACGTPVVAFRRGALSETVTDGETGILVEDVDGMAEALAAVSRLDPEHLRAVARNRFSAEAMAGRYLSLYETLLRRRGRAGAA
jgi:glycosyltransferase involved in cell wall biosynthesis